MTLTSRAYLDLPIDSALAGFRAAADSFGLTPETHRDSLLITLDRGAIEVTGEAGKTRVLLSSQEPVGMQLLRDLLAEKVGELGVTLDWETRQEVGRPTNFNTATIENIERISPSYIRVTARGDGLARFATGGMHFRILLGPDGADWPSTDTGGVTQWPGGSEQWHRPVYTTRKITCNGQAAQLQFDVFLHDGGRVTEWISGANPGDEIGLTGPGGSTQPTAGWLGLVGDETAVPVITRMLSEAPANTCGQTFLFVPDTKDVQQLNHPPGLSVDWVIRGSDMTPVDAVRRLQIPDTDRYVFFGGERQEAVAVRQHLTSVGMTKGESLAAAYWTAP